MMQGSSNGCGSEKAFAERESLAEGSRYTDAQDARVLEERRVTRGEEADRD
jgi:hypothetical protein